LPASLLADSVIELRLRKSFGADDIPSRPGDAWLLSKAVEYWFEIHRHADGQRVGSISFRLTDDSHVLRAIGHAGYRVDPAHRRKGYAVRALRLMIGLAQCWGISPVWVLVEPHNTASRRAVERAGFQLVDVIDTLPEAIAIGTGPKLCRYAYS
jgi:predicted acetyltransferase